VSDEDFSNILGGALYLKSSTVEIMSECPSLPEEDKKKAANLRRE